MAALTGRALLSSSKQQLSTPGAASRGVAVIARASSCSGRGLAVSGKFQAVALTSR